MTGTRPVMRSCSAEHVEQIVLCKECGALHTIYRVCDDTRLLPKGVSLLIRAPCVRDQLFYSLLVRLPFLIIHTHTGAWCAAHGCISSCITGDAEPRIAFASMYGTPSRCTERVGACTCHMALCCTALFSYLEWCDERHQTPHCDRIHVRHTRHPPSM